MQILNTKSSVFFNIYVTYFQCKILWIDEKNLTVCCESGIIGQDLERRVGMGSFVATGYNYLSVNPNNSMCYDFKLDNIDPDNPPTSHSIFDRQSNINSNNLLCSKLLKICLKAKLCRSFWNNMYHSGS